MRVTSYYKKASIGEHFTFWEHGIGVALPAAVARVLNASLDLVPMESGSGYLVYDTDIAFCQLFDRGYLKRPGRFIYTVVSDVIGYTKPITDWIEAMRPNLLLCLQTIDPNVVKFCTDRGCAVQFFPWFVLDAPQIKPKTVYGMCTGCTDPAVYPRRNQIASYLNGLKRDDVVVSCSHTFGNYKLNNEEYIDRLARCRYYFSGAIYDKYIPPKYYEVAANEACLVTFHVPGMEELGFIDQVTCKVIDRLEDIEPILSSDSYVEIGRAARNMVMKRHSVEARAEQLVKAYHEFLNR